MDLNELYTSVTREIIAPLEAGTVPWTRPWRTGSSLGVLPHNAITGREYRGINIPILWRAAERHTYPTHAWVTYQQAQAAGAQVRKGERGTTVVFTKQVRLARADEDEDRAIRMLRRFVVFNLAQIDGLDAPDRRPPDQSWSVFTAATKAEVRIGPRPAYLPSHDVIEMPDITLFESEARYYATLLHELVHWSGSALRLNRDLSNRFATRQYAAEELIAEFGAAFLCAHLGIAGELRHADYVASWLDLLRHDDRAVLTAASKASQAADFLRSYSNAGENSA
jgi:antirestriction protein ArdC